MCLSRSAVSFLLVSFPLFYACKSSAIDPADIVTVERRQSARTNAGITIAVDTITDSRCPVNMVCIWGGVATVSARLTKGNTVFVRLQTGYVSAQRPDSTGVVLSGETYKVVLRDVTPYPNVGINTVSKAVIQVSRL